MTQDSSFTSRSPNNQGYTNQFFESNWSNFMNTYNIGGTEPGVFNTTRTYSWTITFSNYGRQTFDTAVDDSGDVRINGAYQFSMGGFKGQTSRTTPGYFAPGTYTISATSLNSGAGPWGIALDWTGFVAPPPPTVTSFSASPNPQNSSNGTPQYSTTLNFNSSGINITSAQLYRGNTFLANVQPSGSYNISNLPQSVAGSNSPTSTLYKFRACNNGGCSPFSTVTVNARNDNSLSNSWTTSFTNLDPSTLVTLTLGTLAGVDMPTTISTSGSGNFVGNGGSFSGTKNFNNGNTIQLRTTTLPFNTDISGQTGIYGKVNNKTVTINTPTGSFNVTVGTKAPRIKEDFDYSNNINQYPYEDIDFITNTPVEYSTTSQLPMDDIEIPQEIKSDSPNVQVSVNGGQWQDVREI